MSENVRISTKQKKAIAALMVKRDMQSAAKAAGVTDRQLRRWMGDPGFRCELQSASTQATETATRRLATLTAEAIDTLEWAMKKATEHDHARVRAALGVLSAFMKLKEFELENRVAIIEQQLAAKGYK